MRSQGAMLRRLARSGGAAPLIATSALTLALTACGGETAGSPPVTIPTPTPTPSPTPTSTPTPTPSPTPTDAVKPTTLGINLSGPAYYGQERMFSNLVSGGGRMLLNAANQGVSVPAARMDANYDVIRLDAGERIVTGISIPTRAYRGATVQVTCQWTGTIATAEVFGPPVKNPVYSANSVTFSWVPGPVNYNASFYYSGMSSEDPLRNLDCRESDADPAATFDPVFLANVRNYSVVRFLNWTTAVNDNRAVTWATRNRPGSGAFDAADGVALEYMILLANQAHVNPWFNVPWNADAAYVRKMAELVRDTLDPTLKAYVEVSNEVWNWGFKVTTQANKEGLEEGLAKDGNLAIMYRLAEKTGEVMDVWSSVFAGQMNRVVRVISFQNGPSAVPYILGFKDTARKVDAYATAPYFSTSTLTPDSLSTAAAMDAFFATTVPARIDETLTYAALTKAEVAKYGLRYISYEGGQHFLSSDLDLLKAIERDPRMGQAYTRYLTAWRDQIGDLLTLYQDVGVISIYGAWGLQEYPGQPLSEAPKAAAVERFRAGATGA